MGYSFLSPPLGSSSECEFFVLFISVRPIFLSCQEAGTEQVLNRYFLNESEPSKTQPCIHSIYIYWQTATFQVLSYALGETEDRYGLCLNGAYNLVGKIDIKE